MTELQRGVRVAGELPCIANEIEGKLTCNSSDAMSVYEKEINGEVCYDASCFSCTQGFTVNQFKNSSVGKSFLAGELVIGVSVNTKPKERITKEEYKLLKSKTDFKGNGYRHLLDEYIEFYGHLIEHNPNGSVKTVYYPETNNDGKLNGYKSRRIPKIYGTDNFGITGLSNQLSGQHLFKNGGKYLLIVGGEEDKVAAFQMLRESQKLRNGEDYDPVAVVSPTTGESSAHKQIAAQYDFCDSFDIIVIGMDNDPAGKRAAEEIVKVLPAEKVKVASWSDKDPNEMLKNGREKQFLRNFYDAKEVVNTGIKSATDAFSEVIEYLSAKKISLPPQMHRIQENMRGGIRSTGCIGNIIGDTSIGKTFFSDTLFHHWIFNSPIVPTIVSLERTAGELAADLLSYHIKKNLTWFKDGQDAIDYLHLPEVKALYDDLFVNEYGEQRFYIIDERDGNVEVLKKQVERSGKKYKADLVIFDPLTDFLRALPLDQQDDFTMWQKRMKKQGFKLINILHTRKPQPDKDGKSRKVTEYDALGTGSFVQSADWNIVLNRDKMAVDVLERNTTCVDMPKCRGGVTGHAADLVYDNETRQQYDKEDYLKMKHGVINPEEVVADAIEVVFNGVPVENNDIVDEFHTETF